jgi:transposase
VYNSVKMLSERGFSQRSIARKLGVNRRTVSKLLRHDETSFLEHISRGVLKESGFAIADDFIREILEECEDIRSSNLYHQIREKYPQITLKERAFRRYMQKHRKRFIKQPRLQRYFEPVTDWKQGKTMQVDPGEYSINLTSSSTMKIYFVCFVLCRSRQMFISYSTRPYDTEAFIHAHHEAFAYFKGVCESIVYDQTKLVVIREDYREVILNDRFHRFSLDLGFKPEICRGYDPQSKGMVEKSIDYVKKSFLHGRKFTGIEDVRSKSRSWLDKIANARVHKTTNEIPAEAMNEELPFLKSYPAHQYLREERMVDKVGLINYRGRSYSVPYDYQRKKVSIYQEDNVLSVYGFQSTEIIARWDLTFYKSKINKNSNHYRDYTKTLEEERSKTIEQFRAASISSIEHLLTLIERDNKKHIRDQYKGLRRLLSRFGKDLWLDSFDTMVKLPIVSCMHMEAFLKAKSKHSKANKLDNELLGISVEQNRFRSIDYYERLLPGGQQ